ncbi:MAG: response regulator transcription factor [Candidatus Limiplasma sp.]|nr:response regulator transcription factor [Candidatus Limiplasma sp.]
MRLLLVEDDEALRTVTAQRLRREGYAADECGDGIEGMDYAINADYDGLVLDIMLPGMDGLSLLRALRARGYSGGVLLLTARDAVEDRVNGLDSGTDDYLVKPFAFEELSARLRALLRKQTANRAVLLRLGDLEMDTSARTVRRGSRLISLTAKEYALLEMLLRNAGQVLTPSQLYDHVWGGPSFDTNLVPCTSAICGARSTKGKRFPTSTRCAASATCCGRRNPYEGAFAAASDPHDAVVHPFRGRDSDRAVRASVWLAGSHSGKPSAGRAASGRHPAFLAGGVRKRADSF